jgi:RimJ/RimL family protein N-acetyltransferase
MMSDPFEASTMPPAPAFRWIPIRSLAARHRVRVRSHLLALEPQDRYLRFGYSANDAQIEKYIDTLDFKRDEIFGIFNRRLDLIAVAHLAYLHGTGTDAHAAEFGVSVATHSRGRGYGSRLFDHCVLHARNRGVHTMVIHALTENTAMLKIARNSGATLVRDGGDAEARLQLPPETLGSRMEALVEDRAAEFDYGLKSNAQRVASLRHLLTDVRRGISKARAQRIE